MASLTRIVLHFLTISMTVYSNHKQLECNEKDSFRIVQFTDAHFGESNIGDWMTMSMMNNILEIENPDLVVLSGDIISGYTWNGQQGWFHKLWDKLVQPMMQRNIPWIFTPGNHDAEGEFNRSQIIKYDINKYSNLGSFTQIGYIDDKTEQNIYFVNIYNNKHHQVLKIWMIDSGMLDCNGNYDYFGCLQMSQIQWYLKQNHSIHGIIYMHIPSLQLMQYHNNKKYPFIGTWTGRNLNCFDETDLKLNGKNQDESFIDYISQNNDIIAIFHGHEHQQDSLLLYDNDLLIGFGRKSGEGWMIGTDIDFSKISGARVFDINCKNPKLWTTWIRDKYLNINDKTSFKEMNIKKKNLSEIYKDKKEEEQCIKEEEEKKCLSAHHWKSWKKSVEHKFKHWITAYTIDIIDIICRSKVPRFINDYIWDLGLGQSEESIRSGFDT